MIADEYVKKLDELNRLRNSGVIDENEYNKQINLLEKHDSKKRKKYQGSSINKANDNILGFLISFIFIIFGICFLQKYFYNDINKDFTDTFKYDTVSVDNYDTFEKSSDDISSESISLLGKKSYGLGDTIIFDGLELTFDSTYSFATLDNMFSEYDGRLVIQLGVNVKNISTDKNSLNLFFYTLFGSKGIQLDRVSSYFDNNIDFAGELKPGASYKTFFYILYDGDGNYSIDFDNYSKEISVEFNVNK